MSAKSDLSPLRRGGWAIVTVLTGVFLVGILLEDFRIVGQKKWALVTAPIISQRILKNCNKGVEFTLELTYSYTFNKVVGEGVSQLPVNGCIGASQVETVSAAHPIGSRIEVRVNPKDPLENRLNAEVEESRAGAFSIVLGLGFIALLAFRLPHIFRYFNSRRN